MDPLTVLSVASNIIQFIDFGSKLISTGHKVYSSASGALVENLEIEAVAESVYQLSRRVSDSLETMRAVPVLYRLNRRGSQVTTSMFSSREDQEAERLIQSRNENNAALRNVCVACRDVSRELIGALEKLKVQGTNRKWESFCVALKTIWNTEKIQLLTKRLSDLRAQLDSTILFSLRVQINELATQSDSVRGVVETMQADTQAIRAALLGHIKQSQSWQADLISTIYQSKFQHQDRYQIQSISTKLSGMAEADWRNHLELKLINRLKFPGMSDRKARIASAHTKTFEWIYRDPEEGSKPWGNFVKWLKSDDDLYWITGKPGSGKSTLMKYLSKDPRTWHHLNSWSRGMPLITAGFFFWNSGSEMQMSSTGLLQTLLFSCLRQQQSLVSHVFPERWQACEIFGEDLHPWSWMELMDAFKLFVSKAGEERKIFFFVDGMDEFNGKHPELIELMLRTAAHPNVKICLASRPWIVFQDAFESVPSLMLQDLTQPDIKMFVESHLFSNPRFCQLRNREPRYASQLVKDISEKSAGVFLWISLVVRSLLEGLANSDRLSDLSRRLALMPEDLDGLYTNILQSLDRFYFEHASQLIQIVHQCSGPISLLELSFADEEDPQTAITTEIRPATDEEKQFRCETMKRRLNSRSKGLLEVPALRSDREDENEAIGANNLGFNPLPPNYRGPSLSLPPNGNNGQQRPGSVHSKFSPDDLGNLRVEYLHRTVKDFFEKPAVWNMILAATRPPFDPSASLARGFLMRLKDHSEDKMFGDDNMWRAIRCCWDYAKQAEASFYGSQAPLLQELERVATYLKTGPSGSDIFILPSARISIITKRSALLDHRDHPILRNPVRNFSKGARQYLTFQMQGELYDSVQRQLQANYLVAQDADGTPILSLAVLEFETFAVLRMRLIRMLLKHGVNVNQEYRGSSPWKDLISLAISDGKMRQHPYYDLVMKRSAELVELFLEYGADVEIDDQSGGVEGIRNAFWQWNPVRARELEEKVVASSMRRSGSRHRFSKIFSRRKHDSS